MHVLALIYFSILACHCQSIYNLKPTCPSKIYCQGPLLKTIQLAHLFPDSKTFVDMHMRYPETEILRKFQYIMNMTENNPPREVLSKFVENNFDAGHELDNATLVDWKLRPEFLRNISDGDFRQWAFNLNGRWPQLARRVSQSVHLNPNQYSLEPVPNAFVVPGGRFKETYYWDSYWILNGLLICEMPETVRGMLENFFWFIDKYGFIPNGGRVYYSERSQPPLLTLMVSNYIRHTQNLYWLETRIGKLETELNYWLRVHLTEVKGYKLLRYYAPSEGPRPESYREDYHTANGLQRVYTQLKSAAESGWDFSSRWFIRRSSDSKPSLKDLGVTYIIPVDLNAFYCGAAQELSWLFSRLGDTNKAAHWQEIADYFKMAIFQVMWNERDGIWYDVNQRTGSQRKKFYMSNMTPLWTQCLEPRQNAQRTGAAVARYIMKSGVMSMPGGLPTSLSQTGEQWDYPNAWPPLQIIVTQGLRRSGSRLAKRLAFNIAEKWLRTNFEAFKNSNEMYEKYNSESFGFGGSGGEYNVQTGFGWSNGVVLEMLNEYGRYVTVGDSS